MTTIFEIMAELDDKGARSRAENVLNNIRAIFDAALEKVPELLPGLTAAKSLTEIYIRSMNGEAMDPFAVEIALRQAQALQSSKRRKGSKKSKNGYNLDRVREAVDNILPGVEFRNKEIYTILGGHYTDASINACISTELHGMAKRGELVRLGTGRWVKPSGLRVIHASI